MPIFHTAILLYDKKLYAIPAIAQRPDTPFHNHFRPKIVILDPDSNLSVKTMYESVRFTFNRINDSSNLSDTKIRSIWFSSSRILFDTACWSLSFSLLKPRSHKLSPTSKWARKNEEMKKYRLNISLNAKIQSVFSISFQQKVSYFFPLNSCTDNLGSL